MPETCLEEGPLPDGYIRFQDVTAPDPYFDPPSYQVNFAGIADMVSAFKGDACKYSNPGDCPDTCEATVYPDCGS